MNNKNINTQVYAQKLEEEAAKLEEILARCGTSSLCLFLADRFPTSFSSSRTTVLSGALTSMPIRFICATSCSTR